MMQTHVQRVNILGVGVSAINMPLALRLIDAWITHRHARYVCVTGSHGILESQGDARLRHIHNAAGLVTPDGMSLVWIARWRGHKHVERVYGPDLMLAVCEHSLPRGYRHFLYGTTPAVLERLAANLQQRFSGLQIAGWYAPPFRPLTAEEDAQVVQLINTAAPDIVWVGLSTPKQEHWMAAHVARLNAPVLIGVGAAFDFVAGVKPQAPRWIQRHGLEWLFRVSTEPRRLGRRYLLGVPRFIGLVLLQTVGLRRYTVEEA